MLHHGSGIGVGSSEESAEVEFWGEGSEDPGGTPPSPSSNPDSDFALRKAITSITRANGTTNTYGGRGLDCSPGNLTNYKGEKDNPISDANASTTADYGGKSGPIDVKVGDKITYTIRVYNEWKEDKECPAITDYVPEGLKVVSSGGWKVTGSKTLNGKKCTAYTIMPNSVIPKFEEYAEVKYYKKSVGSGKYTYRPKKGGEYQKIGNNDKYEQRIAQI